ncbi:MAG: hypothetical protein DMG42_15250, partial [Acidobacteria bacterium]
RQLSGLEATNGPPVQVRVEELGETVPPLGVDAKIAPASSAALAVVRAVLATCRRAALVRIMGVLLLT